MRLNKKIFFISAVVLVGVILAGVFYYYQTSPEVKQQKLVLSNLNKLEQEKAQQKQLYENYQARMTVVYTKNIENCETFDTPKRKNECFNDIAVQAKNKDYCQKIIDDKLKNECLNSIDYLVISWGNDPNKCELLTDSVHRENCYVEYFIKLNDLKACETVADLTRKTQCQDLVNKQLAIVFNKPEACNLIVNPKIKDTCVKAKVVLPLDSDQDGLPDEIEMSYGTNPFKADTDSDGVSDYQEINKNHSNPLQADSK